MLDTLRRPGPFPLLPREHTLRELKWPLERGAFVLLWILLPFCGSWWLIDSRESDCPDQCEKEALDRHRANWVLIWLIGLIAAWLISPDSEPWKLIVGVLAGLRLLEIFTTGLGTILQTRQQIRARNVLTILTYAIQATFVFAILYHSFAATGFTNDPDRPSDFLYISWSAMVSLGNETFISHDAAARFLEVGTTTSSIFLFGVLLAFGIDAVKKERLDQ